MQFQVPQFTDVEDKIFGPLTLKQFVYIAGGAGLSFLLWKSLPFIAAIPLILGVGSFAGALAFVKINNKPFVSVTEAAFMYTIRSKLYLWSSEYKKKKAQTAQPTAPLTENNIPSLSENKLTNLAWSLDINEKLLAKQKGSAQ